MSKRLVVLAAAAALSLCATIAATVHATGKTTADAKVARSSVVVDGQPFFPVMLIDQCDSAGAERAKSLGANLILNESCPGVAPQQQLDQLAGGQLGVLPIGSRDASSSRLAGWTYPDEPENNGWTPSKLASTFPYERGNDDGLVSFITTTSAFFRPPYTDPHISPSTVRSFAQLADVAGFDLYPLNHCQTDLASVYDAQRRFEQLTGGMPTFQWIETGALKPGYCGGFHMTAGQLTAEAWLAIAGGARGIGFFTHTLEPSSEYDVSGSVTHAIQRFTRLVAAVKSGLVGTTIPSATNTGAVKVLARKGGSSTYVYAVNSLPQAVQARLSVPGLADGPLRVFGEKRSVVVSNDRFSDLFKPLSVHVYVRGD